MSFQSTLAGSHDPQVAEDGTELIGISQQETQKATEDASTLTEVRP
jgi:hypothetical protein